MTLTWLMSTFWLKNQSIYVHKEVPCLVSPFEYINSACPEILKKMWIISIKVKDTFLPKVCHVQRIHEKFVNVEYFAERYK